MESVLDSPDGYRPRQFVRTTLGSFSMEEDTRPIDRKQSGTSVQWERGSHPLGANGQKYLRRKHKRKDLERSDRRNRGSDEYFVV